MTAVLLHARTPASFRRQNPMYMPDFSEKLLIAYEYQEGETIEESEAYYGLEEVRTYAPLLRLAHRLGLDKEALRIVVVPKDAQWRIKRDVMGDEWIEEIHRKWPRESCVLDSGDHDLPPAEEPEEGGLEVVINDGYGGFSLSRKALDAYERVTGRPFTRQVRRTDLVLVGIVKRLGQAAGGHASRLRVLRIPRDVQGFRIKSHAGREWAEEVHRYWGVTNVERDTREYWSD
jgi:hypothetical protein